MQKENFIYIHIETTSMSTDALTHKQTDKHSSKNNFDCDYQKNTEASAAKHMNPNLPHVSCRYTIFFFLYAFVS